MMKIYSVVASPNRFSRYKGFEIPKWLLITKLQGKMINAIEIRLSSPENRDLKQDDVSTRRGGQFFQLISVAM